MDGVKAPQWVLKAQGHSACDDGSAGWEELVALQQITRELPPERVALTAGDAARTGNDPQCRCDFGDSDLSADQDIRFRINHLSDPGTPRLRHIVLHQGAGLEVVNRHLLALPFPIAEDDLG